MLKNVGNWLRKTSVAQKWRTALFPQEWSGVIKLYLFEIKRDFGDRTVYWFISLFLFPSGKCVNVWAESVESRGSAPAQWTKHGEFEMCYKEALKGEKNCVHCVHSEWCSDLTRFSWKKHHEEQVNCSVKFIWRVFAHHCVLKCLNYSLSVKLSVHFSCRDGYLYLYVTWK